MLRLQILPSANAFTDHLYYILCPYIKGPHLIPSIKKAISLISSVVCASKSSSTKNDKFKGALTTNSDSHQLY